MLEQEQCNCPDCWQKSLALVRRMEAAGHIWGCNNCSCEYCQWSSATTVSVVVAALLAASLLLWALVAWGAT